MNAKKEEVHLQALVQKDTAFVVPVSIICEIHTYVHRFIHKKYIINYSYLFSVIMGCGSKKFENVTYFESTKGVTGSCNAAICKCSDAVCQIRLDFTSFTITGPSSVTTTLNTKQLALNGVNTAAAGLASSDLTRCMIDQFSVTSPGSQSSPVICGINTGAHSKI